MLTPVYTDKLSKDIKRAKRQGKDMDKFKDVVRMLIEQQPLGEKHKDLLYQATIKTTESAI